MNSPIWLFIAIQSLTSLAQSSQNPPQKPPVEIKEVQAKDVQTPVKLELYHEDREVLGPCFSVYITGWEPGDHIEVLAFDESKTEVVIVGGERRLPVSPEGKCSFSVPYNFKAFHPGKWLIAVKGKSGMHGHYVEIPAPPSK